MKYNSNNYNEILKALDLPTYWENRLKSKAQKESELSLRMLDELGDNVQGTAISHKLYSENTSVRKHAKSIFMNLSSHDNFKFLNNDFDRDFNTLDEVRIHKALVSKAEEKPLPLLMRWVNIATNENYQSYLIREIAFFKQIDSAPQLVELYSKTNSSIVKNSIVETIGDLAYTEAISILIVDYDYADLSTQEVIIETLGKLGGTDALSFLTDLYYKTSNKERLVKLLQQIYKIDEARTTYTQIRTTAISEFEQKAFAYIELNQE
ncbi:MAG: HEAT repeat domain-containing protein [Flavobacteriaceae bacterium]|jgi:hypothetical protein|nr:HEAT repeat domain-containing protein [Flavobacteriaceae bacterium]